MKQESDDPQLRRLFADQRRTDAPRAPAFEAVTARDDARPAFSWLRPAVALAVVAVMLAVFAWDRQPQEQLVASVLDWESPTDFLLESPTAELSDATSSIAQIVPHLATEKETP